MRNWLRNIDPFDLSYALMCVLLIVLSAVLYFANT